MTTLSEWWQMATKEEQTLLAKHAKSTFGSVRQMAKGYILYVPSVEMAARLEAASTIPELAHLPPISRIAMTPVCEQCPHRCPAECSVPYPDHVRVFKRLPRIRTKNTAQRG